MSTPQTVLITGAGGGLGKAIATTFLAAGANVAICDVNQARLDATVQEWLAAGYLDTKILTAPTDVTEPVAVQQLVAATVDTFGRLDVLVNNAGIMDDFSGVAECTPEMWNRVMAVNLLGPYNLTQAAIKQLEAQRTELASDGSERGGGGGVIINVCSSAAICGNHAGAAYTASKHGLLGLSRNIAFHYSERGIYSIAMIVGAMDTNIGDRLRNGELNREAFARVQGVAGIGAGAGAVAGEAGAAEPESHMLSVGNVARYILFLSEREIARSANGSAVNFTNNTPLA